MTAYVALPLHGKEGRIIHTLLILGAENSPTEEEIETYRKDLRLLEFEQNKLC